MFKFFFFIFRAWKRTIVYQFKRNIEPIRWSQGWFFFFKAKMNGHKACKRKVYLHMISLKSSPIHGEFEDWRLTPETQRLMLRWTLAILRQNELTGLVKGEGTIQDEFIIPCFWVPSIVRRSGGHAPMENLEFSEPQEHYFRNSGRIFALLQMLSFKWK